MKEVRLFGKGRKHRVSYLNARAEYTLQKYWTTRKDDTDAVFCTIRKPYHALQKQAIEQVIHNIGVRSGIGRPLFPHLIRHTTATNAIDHGMDVTDLQKLLRKSNAGKRKIQPSPIRSLTSLQRAVRKRVQCS